MSRPWADLRKEFAGEEGFDAAYERARLAYDLSVQVRNAREAKGLSQSQLAERMGTQQSVIARLEGGGITPTLPTLKRIADALGTKLIVGFEEPRPRRQVSATKAGGRLAAKEAAAGRGRVKVAAKPAAKHAATRSKDRRSR